MSTLNMKNILPSHWILPLKQLGQRNWLKITPSPVAGYIGTSVDWTQCGPISSHPDLIAAAVTAECDNRYESLEIFAYSRLLADGPKILQPTVSQCHSLLHVDLNLSLKEYEQPFPTLLVEFPFEFRKAIRSASGIPCRRYIVMFHDHEVPWMFMIATQKGSTNSLTLLGNHDGAVSLEQFLRRCESEGDPVYQQSIPLKRVALNLSLMLTRYGLVEDGPLDRQRFNRFRQLSKSKSSTKRQQAKQGLAAEIKRLRIRQDVSFNKLIQIKKSCGADLGGKKSPHWRRGHFRRQRVGVGRRSQKLIFVKPMLINSHQFDGTSADTEYRIRIDDAGDLPTSRLSVEDSDHRKELR